MRPPGKYQRQEKAFYFFSQRVADKRSFTIEDIAAYCGWDVSTPKTYLTKKWQNFLLPVGDGSFTVKPEFTRISKEQFLGRASQKSLIYTDHDRTRYDNVVNFELRIPHPREAELKESLEELFFSDGLRRRIREVGLEHMAAICPRDPDASDESYVSYLAERAGMFRSYTITQVNGRVRPADLMSREEVGQLFVKQRPYLVDQVIAVIKFTVPCNTGSHAFDDGFGLSGDIHEARTFDPETLEQEIREIRGLFFVLFVEAIVRTVSQETEIWLLESGVTNRAYRWRACKSD